MPSWHKETRCLGHIRKEFVEVEKDRELITFDLVRDISNKIRALLKEGHVANLFIVSNIPFVSKEINININTRVD